VENIFFNKSDSSFLKKKNLVKFFIMKLYFVLKKNLKKIIIEKKFYYNIYVQYVYQLFKHNYIETLDL